MFGSKDKKDKKVSKDEKEEAANEKQAAEKENKEDEAAVEDNPEKEEQASAEEKKESETSALESQLAAAKEQNVRLLADFDNFRRRVIRERSETYQNAAEAVIKEFLPFYDNFERAMSQAPKTGDAFADGVRMVFEQLKSAFAKNNVTAVNAVGSDFNPAEHDAIAYQPSKEAPEGKVIYQTCCGFKLNDKIIRPASVIVSSGDPDAVPAEAEKTEPAAEESVPAEGNSEDAAADSGESK